MAGAKRFEDLTAWQQAHALNLAVWQATAEGRAGRDFGFRDEIRTAADSAERHVAEGFGRFGPAQFSRSLDISRASVLETKTLLKKGLVVGYWTDAVFAHLDILATRCLQAVATFQRDLRSTQAKRSAARRDRREEPNQPNDPAAPIVPET